MKKSRLIYILIISAFLYSCNNGSGEKMNSVPEINANEKVLKHNIKLSEIFKDYDFIPLETNNECLIGQLTKIIIHDNKFYLLDPRKARAIFVFSSDGRFIRKFSNTGSGPGEFQMIEDFCIEPGTNNLVLLDNMRFLKYYKEDGTYIKTIRLSVPSMRFDFPDENHIAFVPGGNDDYLIITDKEGNRKSSFFKYAAETHRILILPFIHVGDSGLLYLNNLDYTIHRIDGEKISPHIRINFAKDMYTPNDIDVLKADRKNINNFYLISHYF